MLTRGFEKHGLKDWLMQRITAIVIAAYIGFLIVFFCQNQPMTYHALHGLFATSTMKIATLFTLACILLHAWLGMWVISTDYIKFVWLRLISQIIIILTLLLLFAWGFIILWSR